MEQILFFAGICLLSWFVLTYLRDYINEFLLWVSISCLVVSSAAIIATLIGVIAAPYRYGIHMAERNALITTLEEARHVESHFEKAGVIAKVIEYNQELARRQYENTTWLFGPKIDDRFMDLTPIQ